jgi:N6-adenosine-specific RNA methylase IME4
VREVESHYPTLDVEALKNLHVGDGRHVHALFGKDSVLFFWTTDRHLWDGSAKAVLDAWGFERRANMVWHKPHIGLGAFARNQHEQLIIGVRGNFPAPESHLRNATVFSGEAWCDQHSAKPNRLYELIEQSYPGIAPRLELFARQKRDGWDGYGWEYPGDNSQPSQVEAHSRAPPQVQQRVVQSTRRPTMKLAQAVA